MSWAKLHFTDGRTERRYVPTTAETMAVMDDGGVTHTFTATHEVDAEGDDLYREEAPDRPPKLTGPDDTEGG
jgi:hypothetical protein